MYLLSLKVFARACLDTDLELSKAGPLLPELYHVSKVRARERERERERERGKDEPHGFLSSDFL